jgi:hypothetical protein
MYLQARVELVLMLLNTYMYMIIVQTSKSVSHNYTQHGQENTTTGHEWCIVDPK